MTRNLETIMNNVMAVLNTKGLAYDTTMQCQSNPQAILSYILSEGKPIPFYNHNWGTSLTTEGDIPSNQANVFVK